MKQSSKNIFLNTFFSHSKWPIFQQNTSPCRSLKYWFLLRGVLLVIPIVELIGLPADPFIPKSSSAVECPSIPVFKTVCKSSWSFSQYISISSRSDTWQPFVSISSAPTLQSISSLIFTDPSSLGVIRTRARWLSRKFYLWDNNKL